MSYSWWKLPWLYFISHCLVEIYINILEHSINEWIKPPMCQNLVEISTKQWIHPLGIAIQCIYPLQFFIFHHPVDNSTNLGTSGGYATSVFHFPPSSGISHSYSTLFSDSVAAFDVAGPFACIAVSLPALACAIQARCSAIHL